MTNQPHDALFKAAFESPEHAAALFRSILPPTVSAAIDWTTIQRESGSYISRELQDRHSDLLFAVRLNGERALLYLLLEHQSSNDVLLLLRMLVYIALVLERYAKDNGLPLPLVIPAVVCHSPEGWTSPRSFVELFALDPSTIPGLAELIPNYTLLVDDLTEAEDEILRLRTLEAFQTLALWLLRDGRKDGRVLETLPLWADLFLEALAAPSGMEAVGRLFRYISLVCGVQFEELRATIHEALPQAEDVIMTIAEQLREEGFQRGCQVGREEGREEGLEEGRGERTRAVLERQLQLKFGALSPEILARVERATDDELLRAVERILTANTIDAVFGD